MPRCGRLVLVDEPWGWVPFFCTDTAAPDILGCVAGRFSLETCFRELKAVIGAGQQQVRLVRANVWTFQGCLRKFTMTERGRGICHTSGVRFALS